MNASQIKKCLLNIREILFQIQERCEIQQRVYQWQNKLNISKLNFVGTKYVWITFEYNKSCLIFKTDTCRTMNKQLNQELKNFNFLEKIAVGSWVDAVDEQRWKVAKIVSIRSFTHRHVITLHFDGFPTRWDQDFELPASTKLAPFRRFTPPYTGPEGYSKFEVTRASPNLDFAEPVKELNRLGSKKQLKADFINQSYRGEIFVLVDNLLTKKSQYTEEIYKNCMDFFKIYIKTSLNILKIALEKMAEICKENIIDPNIIYVSPIHALINSIPQFMFNLNSMMSDREKRVKFHYANQINCNPVQGIKKLKDFFAQNQGVQLCKAILDFQVPPYKSFSWSIKKQVFILLSTLLENFKFPKIQDNREIIQLLDYLPYIQNKQAITQENLEKKQTELVIGLIKDGNFQGKLKGLNQLKKMIDSSRMKKDTKLVDQIIKSNILYQMTDSNTFNRELFRRSLPLFEYAQKKNLLNDEIIMRITSLHKDKHEQDLKAYYETLTFFAKFLKDQKCVSFYETIETFPVSVHLITFIKDYSLKAANQNNSYCKKYMEKGAEFGLLYFWKIIENSQKYPEQILEKSIEAFCSLITDIYYKNETEKYIKLAVFGIKEKNNIEAFLKIIHNSIKNNRKVVTILETLNGETNLVDSVINSLLNSKNRSLKTFETTFQFLQQVNHHVRKKMTVQHIKSLWKIDQCRSYLLKFMRKFRSSKNSEKSTQKILNKQLTDPQIKEIIEKIFLSEQMMNNYLTVSDQLFQTADQLLVAYNASKKIIDYNYRHTIRNVRFQDLYGLKFYLNLIEKCQDEEITKRATKRFIDFYLRVYMKRTYSPMKNQKIQSWMHCTEILMKLKNRSYFALKIFLEELKGRMKSINIFQSSPLDLVVLLKGKNIKKNIILPRCTSVWKLRLTINQVFQLNNTNFDMFFPVKHTETDFEKEEDFSLALIDIPKDPSQPSVIVTPAKQTHPHIIAVQQFKTQFSNIYGEKILENIQNSTPQQQKQMLDILMNIPPIKTLQKKIEKFEIKSWQEILSSHNKIKLSYQLYIINKIKAPQFAINFNKNKGIQQIMKILLSRTSPKGQKFKNNEYSILVELLKLYVQMLKFYKMLKVPLPFNQDMIVEIFKPPGGGFSSQVLNYFYQLIIVLQEISNYPQINLGMIVQNPIFTAVLQILFFSNHDSPIAKNFPQTIVLTCQKKNCTKPLLLIMEGFLNLNFLEKNMQNSKQFFNTLCMLLEKNQYSNSLLQKLYQYISVIRKKNLSDFATDKTNELLYGWLKLLKTTAFWCSEEGVTIKFKQKPEVYAQFIIKEGLFNTKPRFKTTTTRSEAYEVLSLMPCSKIIFQNVSFILNKMLAKSSWRKQFEWYVRSFTKRSQNEQVGLKNLAATCYINSLLQQLFFIKKFSEPLLAVDGKGIEDNENIVYELQKIFSHLKFSENKIYTTQSLCRTFILDGQPIDPRIQTDVDEFFHSLMDKLQRNLMKIKKENIIDRVFRGEYANLIVGQQCPHKSERIQHFLSMRLQIMNKKSLQQALQEFIKGEYLEGDNAYFCEKCDKKVKALKRVCVKSLPQILILTLKRFQFDFDKMEKFKLNSYCEFPLQLDMFPYMREALYKDEDKLPSSQYQYKLKGTIIHYGVSQAGHYTSYINTQNDEWKYFDDDRISDFNLKELKQECFGGNEDNIYSDNTEKLKNSYILIYQKINSQPQKQLHPHQTIFSQVQNQNQRNQDIKILFEESLINFVSDHHLKIPKTYLLYLHTVILRSQFRSKKVIQSYSLVLEIFKDPGICKWYLDQFSQNIIKEFLIYTHPQVSLFVASLVIEALKKSVNPQFIQRCMKCLDRKNMVPLNRVFQSAINSDAAYFKALGQYSFGDRVYKIIKEDKISVSNSLSKIPDVQSEFGNPAQIFIQKRDFKSPTQLFLAIDKFKIGSLTDSDIDEFSLKIKKTHAQVSFCKIAAQKLKDPQILQNFTNNALKPRLLTEPKVQQEHSFVFYLILIKQLCSIKDDLTPLRNNYLSGLYFSLMKEYLGGYKAERYLIEGLFNIAFQNPYFMEKISQLLSTQKKVTKAIKQWINYSEKAYYFVKEKKLGYWKQASSQKYQMSQRYYYVPQAQLQSVDKDLPIDPVRYLSLLNSIIQKQKMDYQSTWTSEPVVGNIVMSNDGYNNVYEVMGKAGLLLQVKSEEDSCLRLISVGDVTVLQKK